MVAQCTQYCCHLLNRHLGYTNPSNPEQQLHSRQPAHPLGNWGDHGACFISAAISFTASKIKNSGISVPQKTIWDSKNFWNLPLLLRMGILFPIQLWWQHWVLLWQTYWRAWNVPFAEFLLVLLVGASCIRSRVWSLQGPCAFWTGCQKSLCHSDGTTPFCGCPLFHGSLVPQVLLMEETVP